MVVIDDSDEFFRSSVLVSAVACYILRFKVVDLIVGLIFQVFIFKNTLAGEVIAESEKNTSPDKNLHLPCFASLTMRKTRKFW